MNHPLILFPLILFPRYGGDLCQFRGPRPLAHAFTCSHSSAPRASAPFGPSVAILAQAILAKAILNQGFTPAQGIQITLDRVGNDAVELHT